MAAIATVRPFTCARRRSRRAVEPAGCWIIFAPPTRVRRLTFKTLTSSVSPFGRLCCPRRRHATLANTCVTFAGLGRWPQPENPLEDFRQRSPRRCARSGTSRTFELAYTADKPSCFGKQARVPQPGRALPADQVAEARGWADASRCASAHHDAALHCAGCDRRTDGVARDVVRRGRAGADRGDRRRRHGRRRANLDADDRGAGQDRPDRARAHRDEVPLATALGLLVRERLTGQRAARSSPRPALALVRAEIEAKAGAHLDALAAQLDDQAAFAAGHAARAERSRPRRPTRRDARSRRRAERRRRRRRQPGDDGDERGRTRARAAAMPSVETRAEETRRADRREPRRAKSTWIPTRCPTPRWARRARRA